MSLKIYADATPPLKQVSPVKEQEIKETWVELFEGVQLCSMSIGQIRFKIVKLDPSRLSFGISAAPSFSSSINMAQAAAASGKESILINGGYFDWDKKPEGLVVVQGQELSPPFPKHKGLLVIKNGKAEIGRFNDLKEKAKKADLAIQCGPLVVEPGRKEGIAPTAPNQKAERVILGYEKNGKLLMYYFQTKISLYEAQKIILSNGRVDSALNLDGGPSTGLQLKGKHFFFSKPPSYDLPYYISISPK